MPIQVVHNAPAGAIAGLGAIAGDAQRMMQLYPLLVQQDQFAQGMSHQDALAQFEAAQQAARQQQVMQFQAANQAFQNQQQFLQQDYLQRQNIAGHLAGQQNQAFIQDRLQQQRGDDWMLRDQQAQKARAELDLQHQQQILERRNAFEEQQIQREQAQAWLNKFNDPYSEYEKTTAQLQKQGMQYTPDQSEALKIVRQKIADLQDGVHEKRYTLNDVMPDFQALHNQLMRIQPSQRVASPQEQVHEQIVPLFGKRMDPATGELVDDPANFLGYASPDPKTGVPKMVAPNRSSSGKNALGLDQPDGTLDANQIAQQKAYESYSVHREKQISDMTRQIMDSQQGMMYADARRQAEMLVPDKWDPRYTPKHLQGNPQGSPGAQGSPQGFQGFGDPTQEMTTQTQVALDPMSRAAVNMLMKDPDPDTLRAQDDMFQRMSKIAASVPPEQQTPEFQRAYGRMQAAQVSRTFSPANPNPAGVNFVSKYIQQISGGAKTKDELAQLDPQTQKEIMNLQLKLMTHLISIGVLKKSE